MIAAMTLTPEQRILRARIAANSRWAKETPQMDAAHQASPGHLGYWIKQVDPDNELPETERIRRAEKLHIAHMQKLALASSRSRARKKNR
jgi:hypothetical protein